MKHTVYFEMFGRKMKTTVTSDSVDEAKRIVASKIIFHKVVPEEIFGDSEVFDRLMDIFGTKK